MFQREPKLSFKLYSIQLPIIKTRSTLICFNKSPSYLSSYIRFICQLSRQDLHFYVSTRTQAIFQAIFNSLYNYQGKISTRMFQQEPKLEAIFQAIFYSIANYQDKISTPMFQREPKLSFKLYSIHFPIIKARSLLICFNENPSYLSSYIRFNCQLSRQDLYRIRRTRTHLVYGFYQVGLGPGELELTWSLVPIK